MVVIPLLGGIVLRPFDKLWAGSAQDDRTREISVKTVLDTRHFECEAYREVLFRFTTQKILELTFLVIAPNGLA